MAVTLSTVANQNIYGVRSALPLGFATNSIGEKLRTIEIDLKIWNGDKVTNKPAAVTYSIVLGSNVLGTDLSYYEIDIAELVREYIDTDNFVSNPTAYNSNWAAWVEIDWTSTSTEDGTFTGTPLIICTNGFRSYEDNTLALDSYFFPSDVYLPDDKYYFITVLDNEVPGGPRVVDEIEIDYDNTGAVSTALGTGGTTTGSLFKTAVLNWMSNDTKATVTLLLSSVPVASFTVFRYCKTKYDNIAIGYVNRIGAVDFMYFFGKNEKRQTVSRESYKPVLNNNYNTGNAQFRVLSANGKQPFTANTDWVKEETREKIRDLLLTEYAFETNAISASLTNKAVSVTDTEQTMKQDNNELSNYTINFEYAYNFINSVR